MKTSENHHLAHGGARDFMSMCDTWRLRNWWEENFRKAGRPRVLGHQWLELTAWSGGNNLLLYIYFIYKILHILWFPPIRFNEKQ